MTLVLVLHVAFAIFLIGPLTVATSLSPRYIKEGREGLPVLRFLHRITRLYGLGSIVVFLFGLWLVAGKDNISFNQFWVSASMTLFIVALALTFAIVHRDQTRAVSRLESGEVAPVQAGRIRATSAAVALMWLVILGLMFYRPGGPHS